ncbi:CASP-like protein 1B2, partial [Cucurbita argyrosperma subsp. sororia]
MVVLSRPPKSITLGINKAVAVIPSKEITRLLLKLNKVQLNLSGYKYLIRVRNRSKTLNLVVCPLSMASLQSEAAAAAAKAEVGEYNHLAVASPPTRKWRWGLVLVRLVASFATASATLVMALNKESKSVVVATVGTAPLTATISARFQHTPAFIFFVVANGVATLHNWLMIALDIFGPDYRFHGFRLPIVAILDMTTVALASAGDGAATFMAALGKNGNKHARWNKICDKFSTYCDHGAGALIASFVGLCLLLLISSISIIKLLHKPRPSIASP